MFTLSDQAADALKQVVEEDGRADLTVRIFVQGACGCGAAQYGMGLEDEIGQGGNLLEISGIRFVVDPQSTPYLEGCEIDYQDTLMRRGFMITNPNRPAGGGCGCGR